MTESVPPAVPFEAPAGMEGPPGLLLRLVRDQRVAFLMIGGVNTAIGFFWFILFDFLVGRPLGHYGYFATLICAHVFSVLCAFVLYRRFVFKVKGHVWRDLGRFELTYLVGLGVNLVLLPVFVTGFGFPPIAAQAVIVVLTTLISYFGHKYFSFRRPIAPVDAPADAATDAVAPREGTE